MALKEKHLQMYLRMAKAVAETSSAKRLKVGAVAVKNNMVIASGYNGLPSSIDGECETKQYPSHPFLNVRPDDEYPHLCEDYKLANGRKAKFKYVTKPEVRHAEQNLLLSLAKSTESSVGCTIFLTHSPCPSCCAYLIDAGILAVYYEQEFRDTSGIDYLTGAGITVEQIK